MSPADLEPLALIAAEVAAEWAGLDQERMRAWAVIRGAYRGSDENDERVLRSLVR